MRYRIARIYGKLTRFTGVVLGSGGIDSALVAAMMPAAGKMLALHAQHVPSDGSKDDVPLIWPHVSMHIMIQPISFIQKLLWTDRCLTA